MNILCDNVCCTVKVQCVACMYHLGDRDNASDGLLVNALVPHVGCFRGCFAAVALSCPSCIVRLVLQGAYALVSSMSPNLLMGVD